MSSSRPSDHIEYEGPTAAIEQPRLTAAGYARFFWRQLTSMRTALLLLLLLAFAAIPGSIVPQRSSDPNGVVQFKTNNPGLYPVLDALQVFSTYTSVWFSAIYLLLFVSLIGCVVPRARHHFTALRTRPPKTPARLDRLPGYTTSEAGGSVAAAVESGRALLRRLGYRTEVYGTSVSAERGYLRETGNLVFHTALIGVLISVGIGGGFGYTGQRVVIEGQKIVNVLGDYDSFNPGRFFTDSALSPFRIKLDAFNSVFETSNPNALGEATDYTASVTTTVGGHTQKAVIKVNDPLAIGGAQVYLLGNGYAPVITVRDPAGAIVFSEPVAFLPQDANLTSVGVVKVPDGLKEQLGMVGFFYPTAGKLPSGAFASAFPGLGSPLLTLRVYAGDLGLDAGVPKSVFALNTDGLTQIAGGKAKSPTLELQPGQTVDLPNDLGTIELSDVKKFASLEVHHDPSMSWVFSFVVLAVLGLLTSLFIPRRRVWISVREDEQGVQLEYAGLARGEDPGLDNAVDDIARRHLAVLSPRLGE
jgi:cytochrome c biogenesis protein